MVERNTVNILINVRFILRARTIYRTQSMPATFCNLRILFITILQVNYLFNNFISNNITN